MKTRSGKAGPLEESLFRETDRMESALLEARSLAWALKQTALDTDGGQQREQREAVAAAIVLSRRLHELLVEATEPKGQQS